jgi:hypothetical protein
MTHPTTAHNAPQTPAAAEPDMNGTAIAHKYTSEWVLQYTERAPYVGINTTQYTAVSTDTNSLVLLITS